MNVRRGLVRAVAAAAALLAVLVASTVAAPPAIADPPGTVQATIGETSGSYITGFCVAPAHPVLGSFVCSDSSPLLGVRFLSGGAWAPISLPAGHYIAALASGTSVVLSPVGPVDVPSAATIGCTFTLTAAPACGLTGTVHVTIGEPTGTFITGFCFDPAHPTLGSIVCSDGGPLLGMQFLSGGASASISVPAGHLTAALGDGSSPTLGPVGPIQVLAGRTINCTFTLSAAPACDDGDGVVEPSGVDNNGDGVFDALQASVVTFASAPSGRLVSIAAPDDTYTISAVTNTGPPYLPPPPAGVTLPVGVLGFSVTLPPGVTATSVKVFMPAGSSPTSYFKLQSGAWVDFASHATFVGDTVTLHLVDGDPFDTDGAVNGVIVDPGFPGSPYRFTGFEAPIVDDTANAVRAGQVIALKWRLTDPNGDPVSSPDSVASLTSQLCKGGDEAKVSSAGHSGLQYLGKGEWQLNWKTDKTFTGECRAVTLTLADGSVHVATFVFKA